MRKLFCVTLLAASFVAAHAVTLNDEAAAVRFVLMNNRELRAARIAVAEAEARVRGAGRLANPELGIEVAGGQDFEGRIEVGLTQNFPLTARLRLEKEISRLELEAARMEVAERERETALRVREAFVSLAGAREAQALRSQQAEISASFADALRNRVADGFASTLDADQALLEAKELQASREEANADLAEAAGRLAVLLAAPAGEKLSTGENLALPQALPAARAALERPDIRLAEIAVEAAAKDIGLARAMRWQDVGVGVFVEGERLRDEPEGIDTEGLLGMRVSLPLPLWQSGAAAVQEKEALSARRRELLEAIRLAAAHQVSSARKQMQARYAAARQLQDEVLPLARKLLADTQAAYDRGEADLQNLFRLRGRLVEIEAAALESRRQFHLARAAWHAAAGEPLHQP